MSYAGRFGSPSDRQQAVTGGSLTRRCPRVSISAGQPWFYLRLTLPGVALQLCWVIRGGIQCPVRLVPNPATDTHPRTRALSSERTGHTRARFVGGPGRSSCLLFQMFSVELVSRGGVLVAHASSRLPMPHPSATLRRSRKGEPGTTCQPNASALGTAPHGVPQPASAADTIFREGVSPSLARQKTAWCPASACGWPRCGRMPHPMRFSLVGE